MKAILVLEDGSVFWGRPFGAIGERIGEAVFNTSVCGYQEIMTDPANAGKILIFTYPLIGNYGVNDKFNESDRIWVNGVVIKEESKIYSNWQAKGSLDDFLKKQNIVAITELDTRTLAVHLRDKGEMWAAISSFGKGKEELLAKIKTIKHKTRKSPIKEISAKKASVIKGRTKMRVGILDLGILNSLITQLKNLGLEIVVLPYNTQPDKILKLKINGLIISSGPEEDPILEAIVPVVKNLINKIPILGIALGSQLIAKSFGAKINKMHLGHHGVNYPIRYPSSSKGDITVQNHSWVIDLNSLKKIKDIHITATHLNDGTVEEFESKKYKFIAVQYYPASPGFDEIHSILTKFLKLMNPAPSKTFKRLKTNKKEGAG